MPPTRLAHPTASLGARVLPPLGAILAMAAFAASGSEPLLGAESAYLAFAVGVVLLAAAAVAPPPGLEVAAGALLATLAAWGLTEGPSRGAVVVALAAGALEVAAARCFGTPDEVDGRRAVPLLGVVGLALGVQALLRGGELLTAGSALRSVALFVAFPLAGALAVVVLARTYGRWPALLAAAAALLVAPGFRPASVGALVALAAAPWALGRPVGAAGGSAGRLAAAGRPLALLLLIAPLAWDARAALVAAAAGVVLALHVRTAAPDRRLRAWLPPALAALVLGLLWLFPGRPAVEVGPFAALVVLAVPAVLLVPLVPLVPPASANRAPLVLAALLLTVAAARGVLVDGALAAPAALAALTMGAGAASDRKSPDAGSIVSAQGVWSAVALALACVLGAYPWLRSDPFRDLLPRFGLLVTPTSALVLVMATAGVSLLGPWLNDIGRPLFGRGSGRAATMTAWVAAAALGVALFAHLPAAGAARVGRHSIVLDVSRPSWGAGEPSSPPGRPIRSLTVESSLSNSAALAPGTPVATVRLREAGAPDRVWILRTGIETGEWAAGRPDLQAAAPESPAPWLSWVAQEGGFFGRRYRADLALDEPVDAERFEGVEIDLRSDLPADVTLTLFHLELRP